jgi:hydroxymethylbilane synthase
VVLASAGIERLLGESPNERFLFDGRDYFISHLSVEIFVPAGGQGVIALQIREGDKRVRSVIETADDAEAHICLRVEREFLRLLQADCNCPVGVFARLEDGKLRVQAQIFSSDQLAPAEALVEGPPEPEKLAAELFGKIHGN